MLLLKFHSLLALHLQDFLILDLILILKELLVLPLLRQLLSDQLVVQILQRRLDLLHSTDFQLTHFLHLALLQRAQGLLFEILVQPPLHLLLLLLEDHVGLQLGLVLLLPLFLVELNLVQVALLLSELVFEECCPVGGRLLHYNKFNGNQIRLLFVLASLEEGGPLPR